jgi:ABC-type multidrug transport system fused ATPase/permease subunit
MPYSFHLQNNSAHLLRNISSEISIFTNLTQNLMLLQVNSAIVIGLASILVVIEPKGTALIFFLLGAVGFIFLKIVKKRLQFWGEKRQYHDGCRQQQMMQGFSTIKDIKLLGKELYFATLFKKHNDSLFSTSSKVIVTQQLPRLFFEFFAIVGLAFYIIVISTSGKTMVSALPILGFFVASAFRLIPSLSTIIGSLQVIKYSKSSIILLSEEFDKINKNKLIPNKNKFLFENEIQFTNLSFNYFGTNNAIISNLNFSVKKGQTIGIIGESGSGKSTLIDLLLGLLNPSSGSILVDSIDINSNIFGWQKLIGYVPQSINLLDDTIENNIALGVEKQNIEKSKLTNAIVDAQIEDFISSLPEGLNTKVGERGVRLSGGQKQRIGIARSLYNNPSILVLDEATSALDNNTENEVMKSITSLKGKKTIFIIAHRLSTIQNCDVVFNLKNGVLKVNN